MGYVIELHRFFREPEMSKEDFDYLVDCLSPYQHEAFTLRFGLSGKTPMTYRQIASILGVKKFGGCTMDQARKLVEKAESSIIGNSFKMRLFGVKKMRSQIAQQKVLIENLRTIVRNHAFVDVEVGDGEFVRRCPECTWSNTHDEGCSIGKSLMEAWEQCQTENL
jgi:hypothetical protein